MRVYLIYSKLVFFQKKLLKKQTDLKKKKNKQTKTVHVNSASELHCSREQCNSLNSVPITG
jgi:hypothetical protein